MIIRLDKQGRFTIPFEIRQKLDIKDSIFLDVDYDRQIISLYNKKQRGIKSSIELRLNNPTISKSEKNFLEKLLKNCNFD